MDQGKNKLFKIWMGEIADPNFPRYANKEKSQLLFQIYKGDPEEYMTALNNGTVPRSEFIKKYGLTPRMDILKSLPEDIGANGTFRRREDWKPVRKKIKDYLQENGFVVGLSQEVITYTVYIVNLVGEKEDGTRPEKWVYVGETSKSANERLEEHRKGTRSNKYVQRNGEDLNHKLMKEIPNPYFKDDSLFLERLTAEKLRKQNYLVEGGH